MTNADMIRNMSDEELVDLLVWRCTCCGMFLHAMRDVRTLVVAARMIARTKNERKRSENGLQANPNNPAPELERSDSMTAMEAWKIVSNNMHRLYATRDSLGITPYTDEEIEAEAICFKALKEAQ